jgi:hypothetical protein
MGKVSDFLIEAAWLWMAMAIVVVIASAVHYIVESGKLQALKKRLKDESTKEQPKDWSMPSLE